MVVESLRVPDVGMLILLLLILLCDLLPNVNGVVRQRNTYIST